MSRLEALLLRAEATCAVGGQEASSRDAAVGPELDEELVSRGVQGAGLVAATQPSKLRSILTAAVIHLEGGGRERC